MSDTFRAPITVLHVDDEPSRRELTKNALERLNDDLTVETRERVADAVSEFEELGADCIVSDYQMPEQDGLDFLEAVRRRDDSIPFVIFTGKGSEDIASEAISVGVTDYLEKGHGMEQYHILSNRIQNAVAKTRAQAEAKLVHNALETAQEGISVLDDAGEFTYVNRAYADTFGYEPADFVGESWEFCYPKSEVEREGEEIQAFLDRDERWRGLLEGVRADDSPVLLDHSLARPSDGGLICSVRPVVGDDHESPMSVMTKDVLDTSDVSTFVLDDEFNVVWINESTEEYFGVERADVVNEDKRRLVQTHIEDIFENSEEFAKRILSMYDDNSDSENFECHVLETETTEERWLEHWSQPIETGPYAGGRIEHYTDITDQKQRAQELERQNERLEEFASVLSHDLRNPLGIAKTYVEMLRIAGVEGEIEENVEEIDGALDRMEEVIEDVLTLTREGTSVETVVPVSLHEVAESAWQTVQSNGATLDLAEETTLYADEPRLKRLLENLFRNAVEHAGKDVTVRVTALQRGFAVADDGPGIADESKSNVFESGYSTSDDGTGLGLSIVRQLSEAHGWDASVVDSDSGGARFEITQVRTE